MIDKHSHHSPSRPISFRILLLLALVPCLFVAGLGAASEEPTHASGPGYDFFKTNPRTTWLKLEGDLALPAGFFGEGSGPYKGTVALKGVPLGSFRDHKTGDADTIVERKSTPDLHAPYPSRGKTDIELVALSLQSAQPIRVRVGGKTQLWDVKVELSSSRPSTGTLSITQRNASGGSASSELIVYPQLIFTKHGGSEVKRLDAGGQKAAAAPLTLKATGMPWVSKAPAHALVVPGLSGNLFIQSGTEQSRLASHGVIIAR